MDIEMLSGTRGRKMSFATSPNSVASSHDFSFSGNLSASGSPRSSAPILPSLASEMQQAGKEEKKKIFFFFFFLLFFV